MKKMSKYIIDDKLNIDKIAKYFHKQTKKYKKVKFGSVDYSIKRNNFLNKHKSLLDKSKIEVITIIANREWKTKT